MFSQPPLKGLRALIVEDEYIIADDLKRLLKRKGADLVRMSGCVSDALTQVERDDFDFVIIDVNIRGEMAFVIADHLLKRGVPFAFITGYDRASLPARFAAIPNWGKPYSDREVIAGIATLWRRADPGPGADGSRGSPFARTEPGPSEQVR